jgi:hypothetical protein
MNVTQELILACRRITYGYGNNRDLIKHIVQIVPSIRPYCYIWGIQAHTAVWVQRIIRFLVDDAFVAPLPQIIDGCRPAYIIVQTECMPIKAIMRTVHIDTAVENIWFPIWNVFP